MRWLLYVVTCLVFSACLVTARSADTASDPQLQEAQDEMELLDDLSKLLKSLDELEEEEKKGKESVQTGQGLNIMARDQPPKLKADVPPKIGQRDVPPKIGQRDVPPKLGERDVPPKNGQRAYQPPKVSRRNQIREQVESAAAPSDRRLSVNTDANDLVVTLRKDEACYNCRYAVYYYAEDDPSTAYLYPEEGPALYQDKAFGGAGSAKLSTDVTADTCYIVGTYVVRPGQDAILESEQRHCTKSQAKVLKISMDTN